MSERELKLAPEAAAFLEEISRLEAPIEPRARYEYLCRRFAGEFVEVREVVELDRPLRMRLYKQGSGPLLVWFHGGRFISGSLETHDALCRRLALACGGQVLAVDYRLAPEHPYPAAVEDARAAAEYARTLNSDVAAGGDSAGAALALGCGVGTLALVYPMLDPACRTASHRRFKLGPGPSGDDMRAGWRQFLLEGGSFELPTGHVKRALVVTAGADPLLDEGQDLLGRLGAAEHVHWPGHIHGFLTYPGHFRAAQEVVERIGLFLRGGA